MSEVGTLEDQALKRKAKLKALRSKRSDQQDVSLLFSMTFSIYCAFIGVYILHNTINSNSNSKRVVITRNQRGETTAVSNTQLTGVDPRTYTCMYRMGLLCPLCAPAQSLGWSSGVTTRRLRCWRKKSYLRPSLKMVCSMWAYTCIVYILMC